MKTPTVYIAGPMSGVEDLNRPAFRAAAELWEKAGWRALNPFDFDLTEKQAKSEMPHEWYMKRDLAILINLADAIALLPGWSKSRGASCEEYVAQHIGLPRVLASRPLALHPFVANTCCTLPSYMHYPEPDGQ